VVVAVWIGTVLVLMALRSAGIGRERSWVSGAALIAGVVFVLLADVANPEARIVEHNVSRAEHGAEIDASYLSELSADAVPTLARMIADPDTDPVVAQQLLAVMSCQEREEATGISAANLAEMLATSPWQRLCADQ
jgi:predicted Zn-dependent protease